MAVIQSTELTGPPWVLQWDGAENPLPIRGVRGVRSQSRIHLGGEAPPWYDTGAHGEPFNLSANIARLSGDIVRHCKELQHIRISQVLFTITQARNGQTHGLQARVTPLRFKEGQLRRKVGSRCQQVQRFTVDGIEILYVVAFCLPRFLNQSFDDKFITLFHELYHISPSFDGDLRRHDGRCKLHSHSKKQYDAYMAHLARAYLSNGADRSLHHFFRLTFDQLEHRHGRVEGIVVPRPRLLTLPQRLAKEMG